MMDIIKIAGKTIKEQVEGQTDGKDLWISLGLIIQGILGALGVVAVIMIILGGISYITSQGDAAKAKKGRDTIIYALIGLVVALLAFAIVTFILNSIGAKSES